MAAGEKLRDQRVVYFGRTEGVGPVQIRQFYEAHKTKLLVAGFRAFPERQGDDETLEFVSVDDTLGARVDSGRWVATCPYCGSGIALWKDHPHAACLDCGRVFTSFTWPDEPDFDAGVAALEARPDRLTRFWDPRKETAKMLKAENKKMGVS